MDPLYRKTAPHVSAHDAAHNSPTLARLAELAKQSADMLKAVEMLIPGTLRSAVRAGPIEGADWCLLVEGNAAAAKLRQLLPALQSHLRSRKWEVNSIRLKVQLARPPTRP